MAIYPCDGHGTIRPGRLCTAYPALLTDGARMQSKKRFCVDCSQQLLIRHGRDWEDRALPQEPSSEPACRFCGEVVETEAQLSRFYCTVYLNGKDRRDFSSFYCPKCADGIRSEFDLAAA